MTAAQAIYVTRPARFRVFPDGRQVIELPQVEDDPEPAELGLEVQDIEALTIDTLATEALNYATEQVYFTAQRFIRIFEREELDYAPSGATSRSGTRWRTWRTRSATGRSPSASWPPTASGTIRFFEDEPAED